MKRVGLIPLGYYVCVLLTAIALLWLSHQALTLDRSKQQARADAALDESVAEALWRMDTMLTPMLAQEAARPYFVYRPYYVPAGSSVPGAGPRRVASPLLVRAPEMVRIHFQLQANGSIISPQCPGEDASDWARAQGADAKAVAEANHLRERLREVLCFESFLALLPTQSMPAVDVGELTFNKNEEVGRLMAPADTQEVGNLTLDNSLVMDKVKQQIDESQQELLPQQAANSSDDPFGSPQGAAPQTRGGKPSSSEQQLAMQSKVRRDANAYDVRNRALQNYAQNAIQNGRMNPVFSEPEPALVSEGVSRPLWIGENLFLARQVKVGDAQLVQGCWLDWPLLARRLQTEVADILPELRLTPVTESTPVVLGRVLATLPVQLEVPPAVVFSEGWTPLQFSLAIAWTCLALAAVAVGTLLAGVIRLSERRAAFVSAVTHELRTPLTTFRMYTEMLADEMVLDPAQRKSYLHTLRVEAERLSHLVANVLSYARLERGTSGGRRESKSIPSLIADMRSRFSERAAQAGFQLEVELTSDAEAAVVSTDPAAVEQILFNLVDNACKYAASAPSRVLKMIVGVNGRYAEVRVRDFGPGVAMDVRRRLFQPFSKTVEAASRSAPGVGLGLALSQRLAADLGGRLTLESTGSDGALFVLKLPLAK